MFYPPGGPPIAILDEGITLTSAATSIDFAGAGVTGGVLGSAVTETIPGGGAGTVTSVSVVSANGFAGTVATATTTPAITLTTSITGILSGNGTAISAASTTGSGSVVLATAPSLPTKITLGAAAGTTGSIELVGTTSGTVTVKPADAAGTWTLTLPTTDGDSGQFLQTNGSGVTTWAAAGGGGTPGGADTQVQFNEGGAFGGDAEFAWDTTNKKLSLGDVDTMTVNGSVVTTRLAAHSFDSATAAAIEIHNHSDTAGRGPTAYYARSRGTAGSPTVVQSGDSIGELNAVGFDGTDYATSAAIVFEVDGTPGANDMPGRIVFKTSPDGSQTLATALTIASDKSATFVGTVTLPTPFTLGATSVTTTGTQLNYLNAATGTTGTTNTNVVFSTSPTLVTPVLGAATATSINGLTITSSTGTLTVTNAKTLSVTNTLTLSGTDGTTMTFPTTSATLARTDAANTFTGASTASAWVLTSPTISTSIVPTANDGAALGSASNQFSDLFLASGGVVSFASTDWVATHTAGILTVGTGDLRVTTAGTNTASVVTVGGSQTLTSKTLTSPTLTTPSAFTTGGTITLAENTSIALDPAGSADGKYTGITVTATSGYSQAFGDLVYLDPTDSRWEAADANAAAAADGDPRGLLGMVVVAGTDGNACTILLNGIIRADAAFPALTTNAPVYVSETAGDIVVTQPTTADVVIRVVGFALNANEIYFNPSPDYITHV